jgi:hypothetical protein
VSNRYGQQNKQISAKGLTEPDDSSYINKAVEGNGDAEPMKVAL